MKASELKLGNLVNHHIHGIGKIESLSGLSVLYDRNYDSIPIQEMQPIPLTEEWLVKLGFEKDNYKCWWISINEMTYLELTKTDTFYPMIGQDGEFSHENENYIFLKSINYVHELQNLYFALTGQELKTS